MKWLSSTSTYRLCRWSTRSHDRRKISANSRGFPEEDFPIRLFPLRFSRVQLLCHKTFEEHNRLGGLMWLSLDEAIICLWYVLHPYKCKHSRTIAQTIQSAIWLFICFIFFDFKTVSRLDLDLGFLELYMFSLFLHVYNFVWYYANGNLVT